VERDVHQTARFRIVVLDKKPDLVSAIHREQCIRGYRQILAQQKTGIPNAAVSHMFIEKVNVPIIDLSVAVVVIAKRVLLNLPMIA